MSETKTCPICGREFTPRPNQKYCSSACKSTRYYRELEKTKKQKETIERLEKEADWLAEQLLCCTDDNRVDTCSYECRDLCASITKEQWRESARKAVEAQCK